MTLEELITEILVVAQKDGVYREQILEGFYGIFTQKEIKYAIREAKKRGMYSVPDMGHTRLGTWYQFDGLEGER